MGQSEKVRPTILIVASLMCTRRSAPALADSRSRSTSRKIFQLDDPLVSSLRVDILFDPPVILVADLVIGSDYRPLEQRTDAFDAGRFYILEEQG